MSRPRVIVLVGVLVVAALPAATGGALARSATTAAAADGGSACATTAPANHSDPAGDPLGWEDGRWYDEELQINQSDGLTDAEIRRMVARTMARVETIRCLEFQRRVPVKLLSREEFQARRANRSTDPRLRTFDNVKFEALFLINESTDSIAVQNRNTGAAVQGFYSIRDDEIVVISANESSLRLDETTLSHELVHALQDQYYNLSREIYRGRTRDAVNAIDGLVEGDPSYVDYRHKQRCTEGAWNGTCFSRSGSGGGGSLANIGVYFVKFHPYSDGPTFVKHLKRQGGWDAVDAAYEDPPASSEQVIHPEKYGVDRPTNVTLVDRTAPEWTRVRPPNRPDYGTVGEAAIMSMFVYPLYDSGGRARIVPPSVWLNRTASGAISEFDPLNYDYKYSAGWDGDRMHVYRNDENETAYVWRIVWDSTADAREFYEGYRQVLRYWGATEVRDDTYRIDSGGFADAFHVSVEGDTVTIVNAPTVEELSGVYAGLDGGAADTPTPTAATPTSPVVTPTATPPSTPATESPTATAGTMATSVSSSPTPDQATTPAVATPTTVPGFGVLLSVLALLGAVALLARS